MNTGSVVIYKQNRVYLIQRVSKLRYKNTYHYRNYSSHWLFIESALLSHGKTYKNDIITQSFNKIIVEEYSIGIHKFSSDIQTMDIPRILFHELLSCKLQ